MKRTLAIAAILAAGTMAAPSAAADEGWATVNVCDTAEHPHVIGIRASMPGSPRGARRAMRFRVQYLAGDRWRYVSGADSGWRRLDRAHGRPLESGWSFEFALAPQPVQLRGRVRMRWRRHGKVVRRDREVTEAGHRSTAGADPPGFSASTCTI
jgi:hypothetical protein